MTASLTADISDQALRVLDELAHEHGRMPIEFAGVFFSESNFSAKAHNPNSITAHGLFQATPQTLKNIGFRGTPAEYRKLNAAEQLEYAKKYYRPYRGKLINRKAIYLSTFLPALLRLADNDQSVLSDKNGFMSWVYSANAGIDLNKDGKIQLWELDGCVGRACKGPRWEELKVRIENSVTPLPPTRIYSITDMQSALDAFGFSPGPVDGVPGPKTDKALKAYQKARKLQVDGIFGPKTKAQMERELGERNG